MASFTGEGCHLQAEAREDRACGNAPQLAQIEAPQSAKHSFDHTGIAVGLEDTCPSQSQPGCVLPPSDRKKLSESGCLSNWHSSCCGFRE
jgi:hypothetical protein